MKCMYETPFWLYLNQEMISFGLFGDKAAVAVVEQYHIIWCCWSLDFSGLMETNFLFYLMAIWKIFRCVDPEIYIWLP